MALHLMIVSPLAGDGLLLAWQCNLVADKVHLLCETDKGLFQIRKSVLLALQSLDFLLQTVQVLHTLTLPSLLLAVAGHFVRLHPLEKVVQADVVAHKLSRLLWHLV